MRSAFPILCLCLIAAVARAQQESAFWQRFDSKYKKGLDAMNADADPKAKKKNAPSLQDPLGKKTFQAGKFSTKGFKTAAFQGTKAAEVKTFQTRSFFGIKNPWFGRKEFGTYASQMGKREARESEQEFKTQAAAVKTYEAGQREDVRTAQATLPDSTAPRPYLIPGKTPGVVDRFTQNLQQELTIDEVRDLLNKGHGG